MQDQIPAPQDPIKTLVQVGFRVYSAMRLQGASHREALRMALDTALTIALHELDSE